MRNFCKNSSSSSYYDYSVICRYATESQCVKHTYTSIHHNHQDHQYCADNKIKSTSGWNYTCIRLHDSHGCGKQASRKETSQTDSHLQRRRTNFITCAVLQTLLDRKGHVAVITNNGQWRFNFESHPRPLFSLSTKSPGSKRAPVWRYLKILQRYGPTFGLTRAIVAFWSRLRLSERLTRRSCWLTFQVDLVFNT